MPREQCARCLRQIPVTAAGIFRFHAIIPGGQDPCPGSGKGPVPEPARPVQRRTAAELSRWTGPRLWVDADLPMG